MMKSCIQESTTGQNKKGDESLMPGDNIDGNYM